MSKSNESGNISASVWIVLATLKIDIKARLGDRPERTVQRAIARSTRSPQRWHRVPASGRSLLTVEPDSQSN
ncbi:hypothetical protein [Scytonema sp. PCC 10023]|uniref:hypothetical protein n=1 Tax=Scytonema sp. PCC 10023 TaxID=1680591 RepID=UPI0039C74526